jgi:hypothetical protein
MVVQSAAEATVWINEIFEIKSRINLIEEVL